MDDTIRTTLRNTMIENMLGKDTVYPVIDSEGVKSSLPIQH